MCLEIAYSVIAKYPEIFFNALKLTKIKNPIFSQDIEIPEIHVRLFEHFQKLIPLQA